MKKKNHSLQQRLQSTERSLSILLSILSQLPAQPNELSATIQQLSLIQSELESIVETLSQPRGELISLLSHEFLTPLTLIQGTLQLLAAEKLSSFSEEAQSLGKVALKQTNKLIHIVKELLIYQQMNSGQLRIVPQPCPVAELVKQAAQIIQLKDKPVAVRLKVKPVWVSVWADSFYIILVLSHLLSNAIKFSPNREIVTLTATLRESEESPGSFPDCYGQDSLDHDSGSTPVEMGLKSPFQIPYGKFVLFQVKDQGIGIPPDQLEKIFDGFYQIDSSDSRPYNGLGLGLALSHRIIQLHGGQLWAESALGSGSIFYFTIPVRIDPQAPQWWLEIHTEKPQCTYYFGPFESAVEARGLQEGYLEDLRLEQARGITVSIKQCQPEQLTICGSAEVEY